MINNVVLMGRLTADIELKTSQSGIPVTSFCIAVDRRFKTQDGEKQTDFINCVAWRYRAEFISKYFKKGDLIAIMGEIQTRKYTDKNGINRTAFEINIIDASFCGGNNSGNNAAGDTPPAFNDFTEINVNGDDLPF